MAHVPAGEFDQTYFEFLVLLSFLLVSAFYLSVRSTLYLPIEE